MLKFRGLELDFDIYDADTADRYETAVRRMRDNLKAVGEGKSVAASIRAQCEIIFAMLDEVFGEGFHRELFGSQVNARECLLALKELTQAVAAQRREIEAILSDALPDTAPSAVLSSSSVPPPVRVWKAN